MNFWLKENNLKYQNFLFDFAYSWKYITNVEKGKAVLSVAARESSQKNIKQQVREVSEMFGHRLLLCGERW
jgi:hypothetical protein